MKKEPKKYYKNAGDNLQKHKNIVLSNGIKCKMMALGHKTKSGRLMCSNVCGSFYVSGFNFREFFGLNTYENPEKKANWHFKQIKKRIEDSNKDIILVMNYGISPTESKNQGVYVDLALHIEEMPLTASILDDQRVLVFLVERTIKEIKDSFLQT